MASIQLFKLKSCIDHTDVVWDIVTCESTQQQHFLCGPAELNFDEYVIMAANLGREVMSKGRMNTCAYLLPFPSVGITEGRPIGSFVKIYLGESQMARAQKEFDAMTYLGDQETSLPTMVTKKHFPAPRLLHQRILILPLVLTTEELIIFCEEKIKFYQIHFKIKIDLSFAIPTSQLKMKLTYQNQVVEHYKKIAMHLILRKQLKLFSFLHGDVVESNVISENSANLVHRVTGTWPDPQAMVGFKCIDSEDNALLVYARSWSTFVDYDTVLFPSTNYFQNFEDYFSETPYILNAFYAYDILKEYSEMLSFTIIPLLRKAVIKIVTGHQNPCCVTYLKSREIIDPFKSTDADTLSREATFHQLHSLQERSENEKTQLNTYLCKMSSLIIGVLKVFQDTIEDQSLSIKKINDRIQHLYALLHCKPMTVKYPHVLEIKLK